MKHKIAEQLSYMVPLGCNGEDGTPATYGEFNDLHPEIRDGLYDIAEMVINEVSTVISDVETPRALIAKCTPNDAFQLGLMAAVCALKEHELEQMEGQDDEAR